MGRSLSDAEVSWKELEPPWQEAFGLAWESQACRRVAHDFLAANAPSPTQRAKRQ